MIRLLFALTGIIALVTPFASAAPPVVIAPSPHPSPGRPAPPRPGPSGSAGATASPSGAAPAPFDLGVWTVHASSLDANFKNGDFSTPNKLVMTRSGGDVSADRANGNYKKQ